MRTDLQRLKRDTESTQVIAGQASSKNTLKRQKLWVVLAGCIAAFALAGVGSWYLRSRTATIFDAILNRSPVPAVRLNLDVPPKLEDIINKALEKDRSLRCRTAGIDSVAVLLFSKACPRLVTKMFAGLMSGGRSPRRGRRQEHRR